MKGLKCQGFLGSQAQHENCRGEFYITAQSKHTTPCTCECGHTNSESLLKTYSRNNKREEVKVH